MARDIGEELRLGRLAMKLRQADVAARIGVTRDTISRIERGGVDSVAWATVQAYARVVGLKLQTAPVGAAT